MVVKHEEMIKKWCPLNRGLCVGNHCMFACKTYKPFMTTPQIEIKQDDDDYFCKIGEKRGF